MKAELKLIACVVLLLGACGVSQAQLTQQPTTPADKEAVVFGQKIHYLEAGEGPTIILLHGLGGSAQNWLLNIGALSSRFHLIVPDQIGFGKSDKPFINYRIATYVDFLDQLCKQLKVDKATVVGNSMGGWIAASFALRFPERVEKLVLVDSTGFAPPAGFDYRTLYALNPSTRQGARELAGKVFFNKAYSSDAAVNQILAQRMGSGDGYTINSLIESVGRKEDFLDAEMKNLKVPTLVIWGRDDKLVPLADGQRFKKEITNSKMIVFDACGHFPQVEKATEFNAALLDFLSRN